jgi:hypothetical protein
LQQFVTSIRWQEYLPAIVFCADRLVSAGIQFESGTPKIKAKEHQSFKVISFTTTTSQHKQLLREATLVYKQVKRRR